MAVRDESPSASYEEDGPTDVTASHLEDVLVDGRYRLTRVIARGGMSVVHLAEHVALGRQVALKVLRPPADVAERYDFKGWFRKEARTLASFQHPNVVTLHDFGRLGPDAFYLVMEYVDGPTLSRVIRHDGPLPPDRTVGIAIQLGLALRYAHGRGVVHQDVKPSNVLLTIDEGEEVVKLIDFGIAGAAGTDVVLGSPDCMAPEQVEQKPVVPATDQYGLGCVMYRMLTGTYPFRRGKPEATMIAHVTQPVPSMRDRAPEVNVPPALERIVRRCLEKDPEARFPDMDALLSELGRYLGIPADAWATGSFALPAPLARLRHATSFSSELSDDDAVEASGSLSLVAPDTQPSPDRGLPEAFSPAPVPSEPGDPKTVLGDVDDPPTPLPEPDEAVRTLAAAPGPPNGGLGWMVATALTVVILSIAAGVWMADRGLDLLMGSRTPADGVELPRIEGKTPPPIEVGVDDINFRRRAEAEAAAAAAAEAGASDDEAGAVDDEAAVDDGAPAAAPGGEVDDDAPPTAEPEAVVTPEPEPVKAAPARPRRSTPPPRRTTPPPAPEPEPEPEATTPDGYKGMPDF